MAELHGILGPGQNLLCVGDSLTAGYSEGGCSFYPWGDQLKSATGCDAATVSGTCSRSAQELLAYANEHTVPTFGTGQSSPGLARQLDAASEIGSPFTVAVILVGTNDLNHPLSPENTPESVMAGVSGLHRICHDRGVRTVAVSIPPSCLSSVRSGGGDGSNYADRWRRANELIKDWVHHTDAAAFCEFPFEYADPSVGVAALWDDELHLSQLGYAELARQLADRLGPKTTAT